MSDLIHRYIKFTLNVLTVMIFSYVTLAAAAEFISDQPEQSYTVGGKTISVTDLAKGGIVRVHNEDIALQNALFPQSGNIAVHASHAIGAIDPNIFALDTSSGLQVECGIHPRSSPHTAFN